MTNTSGQTQNSESKIKQALQLMVKNEPFSIRAYVAGEALYYGSEEPSQFFLNLQKSGCQSGFVGSLNYYRDTATFFDQYYDEIEELREDYEDNTGQELRINGDLKNWLAWFAFEETAYRMAMELELEF